MKKFVVCINNHDYPASLAVGKLYEVVSDGKSDKGLLRVVDESGDSYLYPPAMFYDIDVPQELANALAQHSIA